ncbi:amidase [Sulfitobacter sp. D35]|uniref:amidase n=1 Tax=Sulfitobacter sp. D35 TaxID=3083252 RepID=UPI00296FC479|nr:amidase [Sulfitobacter sp. D35]MDW4497218.1 amidase [Sulfitobacter sp. D35]
MISLATATIAELSATLDAGRLTATALLAAHLERIAAFDRAGPRLNAVPILDPAMFEAARASDRRRAQGAALGRLDGIPYTAKGSYKARGLPVDAGSPAFAGLIANEDSFAIERLRAAGAVLVGLTTMPPMANGGMQRGLHGRAESPYSADWLTAAFASGSSNGSGTATAAGFGAFGLGEETWSSGRAPASNNGLCAYTPSRGVISVRGNWPLVPTMDVVVPHTRCMVDMLALLDVLVVEDPRSDGDFWRSQPWVALPAPARPESFVALADTATLAGKRLGLPRMYLNADPEAGTHPDPGIGGPTGRKIETRASVVALWEALRRDLEAAGAEVVLTDFPLVSNYEGDRPGCPTVASRGLVSPDYLRREIMDLSVWAWDDFLRRNGQPGLDRLEVIDGARIFPAAKGALPDRYTGFDDDIATYPDHARKHPSTDFREIPRLREGLEGLEETRRQDLEAWMDAAGLDAVVFPAVADVGPADADTNPTSAEAAWRNGVWVANGNLAIRHMGVPTVTVPMGIMSDTGMPVGLTLAGRGADDAALLSLACAVEATGCRRAAPPRTPDLPALPDLPHAPDDAPPSLRVTATTDDQMHHLVIDCEAPPILLSVAGQRVAPTGSRTEVSVPRNRTHHSEWAPPYGPLVIAWFASGHVAFCATST